MDIYTLTVEVRDVDYVRVGAIPHTDLILEATPIFNGVGSWRVVLPKNHAMAAALARPGSGIVVSRNGREIFSGPTNAPELQEGETPVGMQTFTGYSDEIALQDMLAWPVPSSVDMAVQGSAVADTRTGPAETLMHQYVNANIGPTAHADRKRNVVMGTNGGRGESVTKNARFTPLLDLLNELALKDGLAFRLIQRGDQLRFETYQCRDLSDEIILSVQNGGVETQSITISAPTVTRAIVAGQGWATSRKYEQVTTAKATRAESVWGRRIEKFVEQSSTNVTADLVRAGNEALQDGGQTMTATQVTPTDLGSERFMIDWQLGDIIGVVMNGNQVPISVKGAIIKADTDGVRIGMALSDVPSVAKTISLATRDPQARVAASIEDAQRTAQSSTINRSMEMQQGAIDTAAAHTAAGSADAKAQTALDSANGKNKVTWSTANPSGSGIVVGDVWFKINTSNNTVIGQWEWDGDSWETRTIANEVIANLDAGKITAGTIDAARINGISVTGMTITGGVIQTAASPNARIRLSSGADQNKVLFYAGVAGETPGWVQSFDTGGYSTLELRAPSFAAGFGVADIKLVRGPSGAGGIEYTAPEHIFNSAISTTGNIYAAGFSTNDGATLRGMNWGNANSVNTDANSRITVAHGLSVAPQSIQITSRDGRQYRVVTWDATNIVVEVRTSAGALVGSGQACSFMWMALR